jgi:tetratricopeptide (TPR) repeat protein
VSGGVALLLTAVVGLGAGLYAVGQEQRRTARALDESEANLEQADANLQLAKEAVEKCFNIAKEDKLFQQPRMEGAKKLLLKATLPFYKEFRSRKPDDRGMSEEEAKQFTEVGYIEVTLGLTQAALRSYEQGREIYNQLAEDHPEVPAYHHGLAGAHLNVGVTLRKQGKSEEARKEYEKTLAISTRLAAAHPEVPLYQLFLAALHLNIGKYLHDQGQGGKALEHYHSSRQILTKLANDYPDVSDYRHRLGMLQSNLGMLLSDQGNREEALKEYHRARDIQRKLATTYPDDSDYQEKLAGTHLNVFV